MAEAAQTTTHPEYAPGTARRMPFGIKGFDVAKFLISMALAIVVAYFGMKFAIARNTAAVERNGDGIVEAFESIDEIGEKIDSHKADDHKEMDDRMRKVERTTDRIEIMQTQSLEALKDLKADMKEARRERRRQR